MSDENKMDGAEPAASCGGSVGEPLAYAVMQPDSYAVVHTLHAASVMRDQCGGGEIVPLYRHPQPTLTDEERTGIQRLIEDYEQDGEPASAGVVETLRGLLSRFK